MRGSLKSERPRQGRGTSVRLFSHLAAVSVSGSDGLEGVDQPDDAARDDAYEDDQDDDGVEMLQDEKDRDKCEGRQDDLGGYAERLLIDNSKIYSGQRYDYGHGVTHSYQVFHVFHGDAPS